MHPLFDWRVSFFLIKRSVSYSLLGMMLVNRKKGYVTQLHTKKFIERFTGYFWVLFQTSALLVLTFQEHKKILKWRQENQSQIAYFFSRIITTIIFLNIWLQVIIKYVWVCYSYMMTSIHQHLLRKCHCTKIRLQRIFSAKTLNPVFSRILVKHLNCS